MGFGDDLMGTGLARALKEQYPEAMMVFGNPDNYHDPETNRLSVHWSEVFLHNPLIVHPEQPAQTLICIPDYPGSRIYIDYENSEKRLDGGEMRWTKFKWNTAFKAPKGQIFFDLNEKSAAGEIAMRLPWPYFIIEPHVANKPWVNKKGWGFDQWQAVVNALPDVHFIQCSGGDVLDRAHHVQTQTFRQACGLLACAGGFVGTDGGLHHAAAALDVPAVVLWGHYSSPGIFGYDDHINIRQAQGIGCGVTWDECPECQKSMDDITVDEVVEAIKGLIENGRHQISRDEGDKQIFRMVGSSPQGQEK